MTVAQAMEKAHGVLITTDAQRVAFTAERTGLEVDTRIMGYDVEARRTSLEIVIRVAPLRTP